MRAERWIAPEFGEPSIIVRVVEELPEPATGEVIVSVAAAGMNPVDAKGIAGARNRDPGLLPLAIGLEVSGTIAAIGPGTRIATGAAAVGDPVIAYRIRGGYATAVLVPADDVFAKPARLDHPQAANLLLVGTTAAELIHVAQVRDGDVVLIHGASGAVGLSALQQLQNLDVRVIGTASPRNFEMLERFGAIPVEYGPGLADRILRILGSDRATVAFDCVGTEEAVDVSLQLVAGRERIVTISAYHREVADGIRAIQGTRPDSARFRTEARTALIELAAEGRLVVPIARSFPFDAAVEGLELLRTGHPGGKLALFTAAGDG